MIWRRNASHLQNNFLIGAANILSFKPVVWYTGVFSPWGCFCVHCPMLNLHFGVNTAYIWLVNVSPLQEERTLCSLSGGAVTPDSQLDESASPADTTEDDSLPMRPWGRSQSLPAYADLIMVIIWSTVLSNHLTRLSIPSQYGSNPFPIISFSWWLKHFPRLTQGKKQSHRELRNLC